MPIQIRRTSVPNLAPPALLPGQFAVEMASDPPRLWCGVPASIDSSLRREIGGASVLPAALMNAQSGLRGNRVNATTYTFSVESLVVRNPITNDGIVIAGENDLQCDVNNIGANGRAESTAFGNNLWIHFYWIYNPTADTLATIASLIAPPAGPVPLPAGFTHWCYIGPIRKTTAAAGLFRMRIVGQTFFYAGNYPDLAVVDGGATGGTEITVSVANFVPINAKRFTLFYSVGTQDEGGGAGYFLLEPGLIFTSAGQANFGVTYSQIRMPNVIPQNFRYMTSGNVALSAYVTLYSAPNGAI